MGQPETTLRLVSFVEEVRDKTWGDIKAALTRFANHIFRISGWEKTDANGSELLAAAEKIGWPKPVDWSAVQETDRVVFARAFRRLLELQTTCVPNFIGPLCI